MASEWTDSPILVAIMVAATLVVVGIGLFDIVTRLVRDYRRAQDGQPPRRHFHL